MVWIGFATLIAARLANAVVHTVATIVLRQYTPGVVTAVLIVLPLSLYLIRRMTQEGLIKTRWLPAIVIAGLITQTAAVGLMLLFGWQVNFDSAIIFDKTP